MVLNEFIEKVATRLQITDSTKKLEIKDYINIAIEKIYERFPEKLYKETYLSNTFDTYRTGTVSVTNGSTSISLTGGTWTSSMDGKKICIDTGRTNYKYYTFTYVSASSGTLDSAYTEDTNTSAKYQIYEDEYNLPSDFWVPVNFSIGGNVLEELTEYDFSRDEPAPERSTDGTPLFYRLTGITDTPYTLSSATVITFVSTSASDTQVASVYGLVGSNNVKENVTLTGTSEVSTTNSFSKIYYVKLASKANGNITVKYGSTTITTILPSDMNYDGITRYKTLKLFSLPDDDYPIYVKYFKEIPRLEGDADYIEELERTFDNLIIERAYIEGLYADVKYESKARAREDRWYALLNEKDELQHRLIGQNYDKRMHFGVQSIRVGAQRLRWYEPGGDSDEL